MTKAHKNNLDAYSLFRLGHDTLAIANILGISEAEAVKQMDANRSQFKRWKAAYPKAQPKIRHRLVMIKNGVSTWELPNTKEA